MPQLDQPNSVAREIPAPAFTIDCERRYVAFNTAQADAVAAVYGGRIEVGHSIFEYVTVGADRESAKRLYDRVLDGETFSVGSWRGDGATRRHFCVTYTPVRSEQGAINGATVVAMDTTDEATIRERAMRAALAIVDGLGVPAYALDTDLKFISLSSAFAGVYKATYGVSPHPGLPFFEGVRDEDEVKSIRSEFHRVLAGETVSSMAWRGPEGSRRQWAVTRLPLRAGDDIVGIVSFGIDTTESTSLEEQVASAEALATEAIAARVSATATLHTVLNSMIDAVFISDLDGNFAASNDAFVRFNRFENEAESATTFAEYSKCIEIFMPDGTPVPVDSRAVPRALRGEVGEGVEYLLRRKDTGEEWVGSYNFAPIRDADERIIGSVVVARDVTAAKRREAYASLDREVLEILNRADDFRPSVESVVIAIQQALGADAVGIRLQDGEDYPYFAQVGFSNSHLASENTLLMRGADNEVCRDESGRAILECSCGMVLSGGRHPGMSAYGTMWSGDAQAPAGPAADDPRVNPRNLCVREGYASIAVVPIRDAERAIGVVHVADMRRHMFDPDTIGLLEGVVSHIGEGLARKYAQSELLRSNDRLEKVLKTVVAAIGSVVEARDPYTMGHEERVAQISCQIAEEMGLSAHDIDGIEVAALLHDVGKVVVPAEILTKPGALSEVEFSLIKEHSQAGYNILHDIEFDWPVAEVVLQHHERMDGSGYPNGLTGPDVLTAARVLMVADVVEAMAAHRPYRPALGVDAAVAEIRNHPEQFDGDVVAALLRLHSAGRLKV